MGLYRLIPLLFFVQSLFAVDVERCRNQILYTVHKGDVRTAISRYNDYCKEMGHQDFEVLTDLAIILLEQGSRSTDPEIQLMSFFGAGFSLNDRMIPILELGILSEHPQHQVVCLNFLSQYDNPATWYAIRPLFQSPNPLIRLEALFTLTKLKHPMAYSQAEALLTKFPPQVKFLFPQLFAAMGTREADHSLKRLLHDPDEKVRIETILSIADKGRDDFLPRLRTASRQTNPLQQEACAYAFLKLHDEAAIDRLVELTLSSSPYVVAKASHTLYKLGFKEHRTTLHAAGEAEFPYAVQLLSEVEEEKPLLYRLLLSRNWDIRTNSAISLLAMRDPLTVPLLKTILTQNENYYLVKAHSPGKSLFFYKWISAASVDPAVGEISRDIKRQLLIQAINLPEKDFISLSETLFDTEQKDLIPTLVRLLENLKTAAGTALLKKNQQKIGSPLIRNFCTLALFRMGEEGPYGELLLQYAKEKKNTPLIQFRPLVPFELRETGSEHQLSPEATSQLYLETLEALVHHQESQDIQVVLDAIQNGHPKNAYALAGLLIRMIQ